MSPFAEVPCRLQDIDFVTPVEYVVNSQIKDKLASLDMTRYSDDTLFYLFYFYCGDLIQLQAAAALFDKDWRFHKEKRIWLTKVPGHEPQEKKVEYEKGLYLIFEPNQWRKLTIELTIEYSKLAEKTHIAQQLLIQQQQHQQQQQMQQIPTSQTPASLLPVVLQQQLQQQQQHAFTAALNQSASLASLSSNTSQQQQQPPSEPTPSFN